MLVKNKKLLEKVIKNFIGCFIDTQCKAVKCQDKRIKKYVDDGNDNKGNNGFRKGVFRGLEAIPPEIERNAQDGQNQQSTEKRENFFHFEPP